MLFICTGGGFTSKRGTFGNVGKPDTMMCVAFGSDPVVTYSGGSSGNVYIWQNLKLSKTIKAHDGPCFAMHSLDKVSGCILVIKNVFKQHVFFFLSHKNIIFVCCSKVIRVIYSQCVIIEQL